jgi:hypothetical protein
VVKRGHVITFVVPSEIAVIESHFPHPVTAT